MFNWVKKIANKAVNAVKNTVKSITKANIKDVARLGGKAVSFVTGVPVDLVTDPLLKDKPVQETTIKTPVQHITDKQDITPAEISEPAKFNLIPILALLVIGIFIFK